MPVISDGEVLGDSNAAGAAGFRSLGSSNGSGPCPIDVVDDGVDVSVRTAPTV